MRGEFCAVGKIFRFRTMVKPVPVDVMADGSSGNDCAKQAGEFKIPFDTKLEPSSVRDASVEDGFLVHPDGYASHANGKQS